MANKNASKLKNNVVGLQSPWVTTYNKIKALFERDDDLEITGITNDGEGVYTFSIISANSTKLNSIERILKNEFVFGNVKLVVKFVYENKVDAVTAADFKNAFNGNNVLRKVETVDTVLANDVNYVIFSKEIVQFFNDDIGDYFGNYNGLFEDIARECFKEEIRANYCTDIVPVNE